MAQYKNLYPTNFSVNQIKGEAATATSVKHKCYNLTSMMCYYVLQISTSIEDGILGSSRRSVNDSIISSIHDPNESMINRTPGKKRTKRLGQF